MEEINYKDAITLLEKNLLKNIVLIKHAHQLKDDAKYYSNNSIISISFKPNQMQHDRKLYNNAQLITIISDSNGIEVFLNNLPNGLNVLKINGSLSNDRFQLVNSFNSLTITKIIENKCNYIVNKEENILIDGYEYLFGLINYTVNDIDEMIHNNSAYVLSIKENQMPIGSCLVYHVYKNVWEIAALSTHENYRRKHIGESLVTYATNKLLKDQLIPRYHVHTKNIASYNLAIKCGYEPFLSFNHYKYEKET